MCLSLDIREQFGPISEESRGIRAGTCHLALPVPPAQSSQLYPPHPPDITELLPCPAPYMLKQLGTRHFPVSGQELGSHLHGCSHPLSEDDEGKGEIRGGLLTYGIIEDKITDDLHHGVVPSLPYPPCSLNRHVDA